MSGWDYDTKRYREASTKEEQCKVDLVSEWGSTYDKIQLRNMKKEYYKYCPKSKSNNIVFCPQEIIKSKHVTEVQWINDYFKNINNKTKKKKTKKKSKKKKTKKKSKKKKSKKKKTKKKKTKQRKTKKKKTRKKKTKKKKTKKKSKKKKKTKRKGKKRRKKKKKKSSRRKRTKGIIELLGPR